MEKAEVFLLGGLTIQLMSMHDALTRVTTHMKAGSARVFFINAHCVVAAKKEPAYRQAIDRAEFVFNDGAGIEFAAKLLRCPLQHNLNGTDWIPAFLDSLNQTDSHSIFFLGSRPEVVQANSGYLSNRWANLVTVGCHHGYFKDEEAVVKAICEAHPEILLLGMGVPKQELFLDRYWPRLTAAGVRVGIAGGAIFDFMTGTVPRAPSWMRKVRIEWLYRFWMEPKRLWRRYFCEVFPFFWIVAKEWASRYIGSSMR